MYKNFNTVCEYRRTNPAVRGRGVLTNDPTVEPAKKALYNLQERLKEIFNDYRGIKLKFTHMSEKLLTYKDVSERWQKPVSTLRVLVMKKEINTH